jgi:O6-methylguanine-DNA--protein-cysteine methyltransferase
VVPAGRGAPRRAARQAADPTRPVNVGRRKVRRRTSRASRRRPCAEPPLSSSSPPRRWPAAPPTRARRTSRSRSCAPSSRAPSAKQKAQIAALERRLDGLAGDVAAVRKTAADSVVEAATKAETAAHAAIESSSQTAGAPAASPNEAAIKTFFESDAGKKAFAATMKAVQDQQQQEQFSRMLEDRLARFAKEANLTEDQTKKMQDLLVRTTPKIRDIFQSFRDIPAGATQEERDQARQVAMAKAAEAKTTADNEAKAILSQQQFDVYEKQFGQGLGGFGGGGGFGGPGRPRPGGN